MDVGVLDAKNRLSELVERAERGEEIVITRRGKPAARLVAAAPKVDCAKAREEIERFIREGTGARLDGLSIRDLIDEGRV